MNRNSVVVTSPNRKQALTYLARALQGSRLVEYLGFQALYSECGDISIITSSEPPARQPFGSGWGGIVRPSEEWLIAKVIQYVSGDPNSIVLFEDIVSSPSDSYLNTHKHPPLWVFENRVFWPVSHASVDYYNVEQAMAWSAARREMVVFSLLPKDLYPAPASMQLSEAAFQHVALSIKRVITDVYDWEGYIVWDRK